MSITIENASIKHLDRLYEIELACFRKEAFTRKQIAQLLQNHNTLSLIAKEKGEIVGFIIGMLSVEGNITIGHILTIDVCPSHRRKGIGVKLLQEMEEIFRNKQASVCCLEVREDNVAALNLYRKLGYRKVGELENYYGDAHGILLEKTLIPSREV